MTVLRFLASLFLLVAVIALASDATPPLSGVGPFKATSIAKHWGDISPASLAAAKTTVSDATFPWVWDYMLAPLLALPTFLMFGLLALAAGYAGRRRHKVNIYVN
jgi:hypothetical protein